MAYWKFDDPDEHEPARGLHRSLFVARDSSGHGNDLPLLTPPEPVDVRIEQVRAAACACARSRALVCAGVRIEQAWAAGRPRTTLAFRRSCCCCACVLANVTCFFATRACVAAGVRVARAQKGRAMEAAAALRFQNNYALNTEATGLPPRSFTLELWARAPRWEEGGPPHATAALLSLAGHTHGARGEFVHAVAAKRRSVVLF